VLIFDAPAAMHTWSRRQHAQGKTVGCVPTMGALHAGHLALIEGARSRADIVIVSIFVNPIQFDRRDDFDVYPRPIAADLDTCRAAGIDAVYAPTAGAMYPANFETYVEPGDLASRFEGASRTGHFRGVTTVVAKLFGAMQPDVAVFGQKDYQQLAIIRRMVADLDMGVEIVGLPTVRDDDGLAVSSRNVRLDAGQRAAAVCVNQALRAAASAYASGERSAAALERTATERILAEPLARLEYVCVADADTLEPLAEVQTAAVILAAAWFGDVRLIDNVVIGV
jgi:pantoate--beta-alanine ligase